MPGLRASDVLGITTVATNPKRPSASVRAGATTPFTGGIIDPNESSRAGVHHMRRGRVTVCLPGPEEQGLNSCQSFQPAPRRLYRSFLEDSTSSPRSLP